jgi:ribose transport system substrate-binding protein
MMIHRTYRAAAIAMIATAGIATLAGCSTPAPSDSDDASDITIAAVYPNTADPFWQTITCGAAARAEELGVDLQQFNSANTDTATIASNFQSASLIGADAMIVNPFQQNQFVAQYATLMADGVPIATSNGSDPQAEYITINSDGNTAGFAEDLADVIPETGSMVYLGGAPGIPPLENRTLPFVEAVQSMRPDLTVLPTDYSGFDINKATSNVASMIIANPDLSLIIAAAGPDGVGAAAAIEQAGKTGEITLIAFDAVPPEVDALRAGTITVLIAQDPFAIGTETIDALVDYLEAHPDGGPVEGVPAKTIPSFVLTADNVDDPANAKYLYKAEC